MKSIKIRNNLWSLLKLSVIAIIFLMIGVFILMYVIEHYNDYGYQSTKILRYKNLSIMVSIICIIFTGGGLIIMIYRLFKKRLHYLLKTDIRGVRIYLLATTFDVKWNEIIKFGKYNFGAQVCVGIEISDIDKFVKTQSFLNRKIIRGNIAYGYPPITVSTTATTKEDIDYIIIELNNELNEWKKNHEQEKI